MSNLQGAPVPWVKIKKMKTINFERACILVNVVVPFENDFFSCDVEMQITFCTIDAFDMDVAEYHNCKSLLSGGADIAFSDARDAFKKLGVDLESVIDDYATSALTKDVILENVKKAINFFVKK